MCQFARCSPTKIARLLIVAPCFSSQPLTPAVTQTVHIKAACRASCESSMTALLRFRITTVTECIDLGEIFWSTLTLGCCSWTSRIQSEFGSTARRKRVQMTHYEPNTRDRYLLFVSQQKRTNQTTHTTTTKNNKTNTQRKLQGRI